MSNARDFAARVPVDGALSNRNLIINGAMQVAQRGTSVSALTGSGYKTVDRWNVNASGATYNQSQEAITLGDSIVGEFKYYLKHDVTTGDDNHGLTYRIEDVQSVPEGTVTLSFYAKGTNPNSGHLEMIAKQDFGTGGSPSSDVTQSAQDITLTSSWQRFELQITVPSISGKTIGTNADSYYQIRIAQPADDDNSAAWELNLTGVQLEVGDTVTPFEHRSYGDVLAQCQRYFFKVPANSWIVVGDASNTGVIRGLYNFPVEMRADPTCSSFTLGHVNGGWQHSRTVSAPKKIGINATSYTLNLLPANQLGWNLQAITCDAEL